MKLEDILLDESAIIKDAAERLEKVRCKVVYIVRERKLVASISDGDIRRFTIQKGNYLDSVKKIANYKPTALHPFQKREADSLFKQTEIYSIPIINYNQEVVEVYFRTGICVRSESKIGCPVVMMAGGKGTRLYPYTKILPKALIPVGDIPISEIIINRFCEYSCNDIYMLVNHKKSMIQAYFEGIEKEYTMHYVEERRPLGTGGGLYLLKEDISQDFFLVNCDILIDADYTEIYNQHKAEGNLITLIVAKYKHIIPYGVVTYDNDNTYREMSEKPCVEYAINTGMYIVSQQVVRDMPEDKELTFPEVIDRYKKMGNRIGVYVIDESAYMDMGQLEELEKMKQKLNIH